VLLALINVRSGGIRADEPAGGTAKSPPHTEAVQRGNMDLSIRAVGTIEPEEAVDVSALVAGAITRFGDDPAQPNHQIGWNSKVDVGTVLACIDDSSYRNACDTARISLDKSRAAVRGAQAALDKATAEYERVKALFGAPASSQAGLDMAKLTVTMAKANLEVAEAQVELDKIALRQAQHDLMNTTITSPVKGVVIDRRINVGQVVGTPASNTPSLFLIASDPAKLQAWMSIPEDDIARIKKGQTVAFTVEALPHKVFEGQIEQIRLNATMNHNMVTYTVVATIDNSKGELLPYMTVTAEIKTDGRKNVLLVPNAALTFHPRGRPRSDNGRGRVWVEDGGTMRPVDLKLGLTNQVMTEVVEGDIKEGTRVVVGE